MVWTSFQLFADSHSHLITLPPPSPNDDFRQAKALLSLHSLSHLEKNEPLPKYPHRRHSSLPHHWAVLTASHRGNWEKNSAMCTYTAKQPTHTAHHKPTRLWRYRARSCYLELSVSWWTSCGDEQEREVTISSFLNGTATSSACTATFYRKWENSTGVRYSRHWDRLKNMTT